MAWRIWDKSVMAVIMRKAQQLFASGKNKCRQRQSATYDSEEDETSYSLMYIDLYYGRKGNIQLISLILYIITIW